MEQNPHALDATFLGLAGPHDGGAQELRRVVSAVSRDVRMKPQRGKRAESDTHAHGNLLGKERVG